MKSVFFRKINTTKESPSLCSIDFVFLTLLAALEV